MLREISLAEVKRHNSEKSDWIVIHNEVYDVTKYLSEHPGGEETLLEVAGQVATQSFEDIGHSDDAREIMKKYKIGALPANEHSTTNSEASNVGSKKSKARDMESWCTAWNREYVVYPAKTSQQCCGPDEEADPATFDGAPAHKRKPLPVAKSTSAPRIERRVNAIVVPRERPRRPRGHPCSEGSIPHIVPTITPIPQRRRSSVAPESGNWWKWALLVLAGAITVGLIVKKKMGT